MTLGGGVLNCWANRRVSRCQAGRVSCSQPSGTRSLGIQSELMDLGYNCSVTVGTDSQSVIDHSRRRGHSVASRHVGLRGLWLQEALVVGKMELEKVDNTMNPADVCTKASPGNRIRELCRLTRLSRSRHGSRTKQRASIHNISSTLFFFLFFSSFIFHFSFFFSSFIFHFCSNSDMLSTMTRSCTLYITAQLPSVHSPDQV